MTFLLIYAIISVVIGFCTAWVLQYSSGFLVTFVMITLIWPLLPLGYAWRWMKKKLS